ncbi:MAG TPA: PAS domain-containing protein, partial [Steroidobacteraceae bacterium]|nr:PAS domain-containing protein [Steroidobacteraceae bacterium]
MSDPRSSTAQVADAPPSGGDPLLPFDSIDITSTLASRPARAPNYAAENAALGRLIKEVSGSSASVLQSLVDATLALSGAHSAGISLLESVDGEQCFVWRAVSGRWARLTGSTMARNASPCGDVLNRKAALLLLHPERHYPIPPSISPPIFECLLVPFYSGDEVVGTVWALSHDDSKLFDREDLRVLESMAHFAATAYQVLDAHESERTASRRLQTKTIELQRLAETAAVGLTRIRRDLVYRTVNRAYAELVGRPASDIIGKSMLEVLGPRACETIRPYVERTLQGEAVEYETVLPLPTGARFAHINYTPDIEAGEIVGWTASIMDITGRRISEQNAQHAAREKDALYRLADRLQRARNLNEVYEAALRAILSAVQCDRASILLFDPANVMRFVAWHGLSDTYRAATEGHSPWTIRDSHPEPIAMNDAATAGLEAWLEKIVRGEGIGALAFIPLTFNGRLIGKFMTYYNRPHEFTADEIDLSLTIARQLAFAVDHQRAQAELEAQASQLDLITNTAPVFIAYCDQQTRFKFVNHAYAKRLGLTATDCLGKRIDEVIGERAYESLRPYIDEVLSGTPVEFELTIPYPTLGERFMHCSYAPERNDAGVVVGLVAAITDITERKHAEEALRRSEEKLREADRRKDEFLAMLAHELRNPLAPIANALSLMQREGTASALHEQSRAIMERQIGRLSRLVDDLLEVSRITTGRIQLHMEPVPISDVIARAVETARPLIHQHNHDLQVGAPEQPVWIRGDSARLEQVLVNLLNNAAKYTDDGGRIELKTERDGNDVLIRVIDSGIGIAPDLLPRMFDLFTQGERSLDRSRGGLGIGLSLVQRLVTKHGGTVEARSTPGEGSEFIVRLPTVDLPAPVSDTQEREESQPAAGSVRVLIVDDNADAAESLALLLETSGHTVATAHTGTAALAAVEAHRPEIIFLDIGLPELDGYEVAKRVRIHHPPDELVLVAMTGYGQQSDRDRSHAAGFDHHLVKPAAFEDI